jgi:hypothetical protein
MGGNGGIAPPFLASALDGGEWSASCPGRFIPEEIILGTHWIGDWLWKEENPRSFGNRTPSIQPVARCYTDFDVHSKWMLMNRQVKGKWGGCFLLYLLRPVFHVMTSRASDYRPHKI